MLAPTPPEEMLDLEGRPYFLWDCELDDAQFRTLLSSEDGQVRARYLARMMRQARPDDVFEFVGINNIRRDWAQVQPLLGRKKDFWTWLMNRWNLEPNPAPPIE